MVLFCSVPSGSGSQRPGRIRRRQRGEGRGRTSGIQGADVGAYHPLNALAPTWPEFCWHSLNPCALIDRLNLGLLHCTAYVNFSVYVVCDCADIRSLATDVLELRLPELIKV